MRLAGVLYHHRAARKLATIVGLSIKMHRQDCARPLAHPRRIEQQMLLLDIREARLATGGQNGLCGKRRGERRRENFRAAAAQPRCAQTELDRRGPRPHGDCVLRARRRSEFAFEIGDLFAQDELAGFEQSLKIGRPCRARRQQQGSQVHHRHAATRAHRDATIWSQSWNNCPKVASSGRTRKNCDCPWRRAK